MTTCSPSSVALATATLVLLSACAGSAPPAARAAPASASAEAAPPPVTNPATPEQAAQAVAPFAQAVTTPLADLNLVRAEIPPVLMEAQRGPYAVPADASCAGLAAQVQALDAVLGVDLDMPPLEDNPGLVERGVGLIGESAVGSVRNTAESIVPFRSWVRRLTGAERYSREVAAAIAAGTIRRAYLKGMGQAGRCAVPASPRR